MIINLFSLWKEEEKIKLALRTVKEYDQSMGCLPGHIDKKKKKKRIKLTNLPMSVSIREPQNMETHIYGNGTE